MSVRVLVSCRQMQRHIDSYAATFAELGISVDLPTVVQQLNETELVPIIEQYDGVIAGDDHFTSDVIARATRLRVISKWGVGVDNIDHEAARARGILVTNTPGVFADEVADVAMAYVTGLARRLHLIDRLVRAGQWPRIEGESLAGKTLGVIGFGAIGAATASRAEAAGMRVICHDVNPAAAAAARVRGIESVSLRELLGVSRFVLLACALTSDNRRMISAAELAALTSGSYLVNVSRGALVDEDALVDALASGRLGGAALDVFEEEPLPVESPLRWVENCILGSHNGSNAYEAVLRTNQFALRNLLSGLGLEAPK